MNEHPGLQRLNSWNEKTAWDELLRCCGASKWALRVMNARPFADLPALHVASDAAFARLEYIDWHEAFSHHPPIGDPASLREKFGATREWASGEQAGTQSASEAILWELAQQNQEYLDKFGFIFIICATGKSAAEMLEALQNRIGNSAEDELRNATQEQKQITRLRLEKLLAS